MKYLLDYLTIKKRNLAVGIVLFAVSLSGCVDTDSNSERLVGMWNTCPILGQVGRVVSSHIFFEDGSWESVLHYLDADLPPDKLSGTYKVSNDMLTIISETKTHTVRFFFDGADLMIDEEGGLEMWRYRRIEVGRKD